MLGWGVGDRFSVPAKTGFSPLLESVGKFSLPLFKLLISLWNVLPVDLQFLPPLLMHPNILRLGNLSSSRFQESDYPPSPRSCFLLSDHLSLNTLYTAPAASFISGKVVLPPRSASGQRFFRES
jgi:hypothetical protein